MTLHRSEYIDQKRTIGLLVASLVKEGETLILDAGIRLTTPSFAGLRLKEAMIQAASRVCLVADCTRINHSSLTRLSALEAVHAIITDDGISNATRANPARPADTGPARPPPTPQVQTPTAPPPGDC